LYLLGTINMFFALTMGVILKYFTTDGFTSNFRKGGSKGIL
jgi:hypothetical protein